MDCLLFFVLGTSKGIYGRVLTCDSALSWQPYSVAPVGDQAASMVT